MRYSSSILVFIVQIGIIYSQSDNSDNVLNEIKSDDSLQRQDDTLTDNIELNNITETSTQPYSVNDGKPIDPRLSRYLQDNPDAVVITSPNYPNAYPTNYNHTWSIDVNGGTGIDVTIHDLDINPLTDFLYFRGGTEESPNEKGPKLTGHHTMPLKFKIIHTTNLYIWFFADDNLEQDYRGFLLTYAPIGATNDLTETPNEVATDSPTAMETMQILTVVPKQRQNIESWHNFKSILANSTNNFISKYNMFLESASTDNVSMVIKKCSSNWPDSANCLDIKLAISLRPINNETGEIEENPLKYELTSPNLIKMWDEFGKSEFLRYGIEEYNLPDTTFIILLWTGITFVITILFLFVLYTIWRMEIFQEYRRMSTAQDDHRVILKNQSEMDISMFPSPHQVVPTLFPTNGEGYIPPSAANIHYDDNLQSRKNSFAAMDYATRSFELNDLRGKQNSVFDDDEVHFSKVNPSSVRNKAKFQIKGSSKNSSTT